MENAGVNQSASDRTGGKFIYLFIYSLKIHKVITIETRTW